LQRRKAQRIGLDEASPVPGDPLTSRDQSRLVMTIAWVVRGIMDSRGDEYDWNVWVEYPGGGCDASQVVVRGFLG